MRYHPSPGSPTVFSDVLIFIKMTSGRRIGSVAGGVSPVRVLESQAAPCREAHGSPHAVVQHDNMHDRHRLHARSLPLPAADA